MKILYTTILTFLTFASQAQEIVWDSTFVVDQIEFIDILCIHQNRDGSQKKDDCVPDHTIQL